MTVIKGWSTVMLDQDDGHRTVAYVNESRQMALRSLANRHGAGERGWTEGQALADVDGLAGMGLEEGIGA